MDTEIIKSKEPKVLKTKCINCIFLNISGWGELSYQIGCDLGKEIHQDGPEKAPIYCKGFCNQKREEKWVGKLKKEGKEGAVVLESLDKENRTLSLYISCVDDDLDEIYTKLKHTLSCSNFAMFCDVTISLQIDNPDKQKLLKINNLILEKIPEGTKWNLDSILYKDKLDRPQQENYSSRLCGGSWIVFMVAGDFLGRTEYVHFRENIEDRKNSVVMFDLGLKMIINRNCYLAMNGHLDFSFQEKLKQFDNYSECCKEIK